MKDRYEIKVTEMAAASTLALTEAEKKRVAFISALRQYADLLEDNSEVPAPQYGANIYVHDCTKEQLVAATRMGIKVDKEYSSSGFDLYLRLGRAGKYNNPTLTINFSAKREEVCERVVLGTKHVPEEQIPAHTIPAHDEEIVEWKCKPLLAEEGE